MDRCKNWPTWRIYGINMCVKQHVYFLSNVSFLNRIHHITKDYDRKGWFKTTLNDLNATINVFCLELARVNMWTSTTIYANLLYELPRFGGHDLLVLYTLRKYLLTWFTTVLVTRRHCCGEGYTAHSWQVTLSVQDNHYVQGWVNWIIPSPLRLTNLPRTWKKGHVMVNHVQSIVFTLHRTDWCRVCTERGRRRAPVTY